MRLNNSPMVWFVKFTRDYYSYLYFIFFARRLSFTFIQWIHHWTFTSDWIYWWFPYFQRHYRLLSGLQCIAGGEHHIKLYGTSEPWNYCGREISTIRDWTVCSGRWWVWSSWMLNIHVLTRLTDLSADLNASLKVDASVQVRSNALYYFH